MSNPSHFHDGVFAVLHLVADKDNPKDIDGTFAQRFYREKAVIDGAEFRPCTKNYGRIPAREKLCLQ